MKRKYEIEEVLKDCKDAVKEYELSEDGGDLINQGWIEALEWILLNYKGVK